MEETGNTLKFGNFEILKREDGSNIELGRGSYGVTYKANHRYLRKIVALKVIHDRHMENAEATQRFLNEAQIVASLDHRNIARVSDFGEHDGIFFYAMEFCDGGSLEDLSNRSGPLSWSAIIPLARQIAKALECAHSAGLLHRDIKPSNLMLFGDPQNPVVKLIDFGLVKVLESAEKSSTFQMVSRDGGFIGNPMSAAPEQLLEETIDARADLFSLGITLWYLLLAKSPFEGVAPAKLVHERLSEKPYDPGDIAGLDEHGRAILTKLIAKNPDDRFASAGDLIQALDNPSFGRPDPGSAIDTGSAIDAPPEPASPEPPPLSVPAPVAATSPSEPSAPPTFDGLRVVRRLSSNSLGVVAMVNHAGGGGMIVAHPDVARIEAPLSGGLVEWGSYGGEPALLFRGLTASNWDNTYSLSEEPTKAEFLSWFNQIAHIADLFRKAGFVEFDFRPSNILLLSNPLDTAGGRSQWFAAPRFEDNSRNQDAWNSIGGDSLAPTSLSAFAALVYRSISGMRLKPAAFIKQSAYVKSPNLTEAGNNLIASTLSATPEAVAQTGYADFLLELSRSEQIGLIELAPPPAALLTPFSAETLPPAMPLQSQAGTPVPAPASSSPPPLAPAGQPNLPPEAASANPSAKIPPLPPSDSGGTASVSPSSPTPGSGTPQDAASHTPASSTKPSGKRLKIIAAAAAILVAGVTSIILIPKNEDPIVKNGNGKADHEKNPDNGGEGNQTAVSYEQLNLANVSWLVPGAYFEVRDRDNVPIVSKQAIGESTARIFNFSSELSETRWKRSAPFVMEITYQSEGVCDMQILIKGIAKESFAATEENPTRLTLNPDGLTASIKGSFAPQFVPVIENDASGFNDGKPLSFSEGDPIQSAVHYTAGTETKTAGSAFKDGRFVFEIDGATEVPELRVTSKLFSKEASFPMNPPFPSKQVPLSMVEVSADPKQTGVWLDGLVIKSGGEGRSPFWDRIRAHTPVLTTQNPSAKILKGLNYEAVISGGPLDALTVAEIHPESTTQINLPSFPKGYAFGKNENTPYDVNNVSKGAPAYYAISMPPDELWRCVIFGFDVSLNDGQGGFYITEGIMKPKTYDPSRKQLEMMIDFEASHVRRQTIDLKKIFTSASIQIPTVWEAKKHENLNYYAFQINAKTANSKGQEYHYQGGNENDPFIAIEDGKVFAEGFRNQLIRWVITLKSSQDDAQGATEEEKKALEESVRKMKIFPDDNAILGLNAFKIESFNRR